MAENKENHINLELYGYKETEAPPDGQIPGRVVEQHKEQYRVVTERGEMQAGLKGSFYHNADSRESFPCVGDFVFLQYNAGGPSLITRLLPRRTKFSRADFSGHAVNYAKTILEQVIAANVDYVFIITSLNRDFKLKRIERYLTQARQSGAAPVALLTKADLVEDPGAYVAKTTEAFPGVPVHAISNLTGQGHAELDEYLKPGATVVFLGMSGVGKSSLLNSLIGSEVMTVNDIREDDSRGRHTTTHRQLFTLPGGAMVIDTPGMRELGLFDSDEGVNAAFSDIAALVSNCRFSDCRHRNEPGCAVRAALEDGTLQQKQWDNYMNQRRELKYTEERSAYLHAKDKRGKEIAMWSRSRKKSGDMRL